MIEGATEASLLQILTLVRNTVELNHNSLHFMVLTTQCETRGPHITKSEQEFNFKSSGLMICRNQIIKNPPQSGIGHVLPKQTTYTLTNTRGFVLQLAWLLLQYLAQVGCRFQETAVIEYTHIGASMYVRLVPKAHYNQCHKLQSKVPVA